MKIFSSLIPIDKTNKLQSLNKNKVYLLNYIFISPILFLFNPILFFLALPFFLIGYVDDRYDLSINARFIICFLVLLVFFYFDSKLSLNFLIINFDYIHFNKLTSVLLSIILILGFIHIMNMTDGRNANFGMYMFLLYSTILFNLFYFNNENNIFLFITCLSLIIVNIINLYSFSFFGNNGVYPFCFYSALIMFSHYENLIISSKNIYAIFTIPFLDALYVSFLRIKSGVSPFIADLSHLHHLPSKWTHGLIIIFLFVSSLLMISYILPFKYLIIISILMYLSLRFILKKL